MIAQYKFEWTKDISVNEGTIDLQHQKLLLQVNKLIEATLNKVDETVLAEAVKFLETYIREHFQYEEQYMKSINFPEIAEHIELHKNFIDHYVLFKDRIADENKLGVLLEMETYMGNWWLTHIGKEDKKYALFLGNKNK